jgi:hypothetical protein
MNILDASKSNLGKLLASENIRIEHHNVHTASFNVMTRVLVLPIWKEMDSDLYDLLIGHEVGHALFTPQEGWVEKVEEKGPMFKSCLNIVEDARIEKMMRDKYPGLRKPMYSGYTQLVNRNFFGVPLNEMNNLPFVDRVNCFFKLGNRTGITFNETEQVLVDNIANADTWEQVMSLAEELMEICEDEMSQIDNAFGDFEDSFEDIEFSDIDMDTQDFQESKSFEEMIEELRSNNQNDLADRLESASEELREKMIGRTRNNPSITEEAMENAQKKNLVDENQKHDVQYATWPKLKLKDFVVSYKDIYNGWNINVETGNKLYHEFMNKNKNYINYLVKEFTLKQNAKQLAKARVSKTGKLNMDKLWSYQITDNLFLQTTEIPNGKNHGMIMLLDMSASMSDILKGTIEQTIALSMFCRKVNIPFEVYGFTDNYYGNTENYGNKNDPNPRSLQIVNNQFRLNQLISSKMRLNEFNKAIKNLLYFSEINSPWATPDFPAYMTLGGTPLDESILVLRWIAEEFKNNNKVEILNTIILTDGETTGHLNIGEKPCYGNLVIEDGTQSAFGRKGYYSTYNITGTLLDLYKRITDSRVVGIYLSNQRNPKKNIQQYWSRYGQDFAYDVFEERYATQFKEHKYISIPMTGYDDFYIVSGRDLDIEGMDLDKALSGYKNQESRGSILRAFKKTQNSKKVSRVFLNQFIQQIA